MKKKILVVILNDVIDTVGGAITAFYNFTGMLIENGYEVTGVFSKKNFSSLQKVCDNGLKLVNLQNNKFENIVNNENPDLMIFFYPRDVLKTLKQGQFLDIPKILMNHTRPDFYVEYSMIKDVLKDFKCVQVLFENFKPMVKKYFNGEVVTIGNEVPSQPVQEKSEEFKNIIYLSRVDVWKGHEFLIKSFAKIAKNYPEWKLNIYGQFDPKRYKKQLEKLIKKLGLKQQVNLNGVTTKPKDAMQKADFCVFPSYFEGFGLGLAEALSIGLPAVGFKGATGVNQLIENGVNGFLTDENEVDFSKKIEDLINDRTLRSAMSENAVKSVRKYSKEIISKKWLVLIEKVLNFEKVEIVAKDDFVKYEIFPMQKIYDIMYQKRCMSFAQKIFSISNLGQYKMICILGIKFKVQRI